MKPSLTVLGTTASLSGDLTVRNFDSMLTLIKEIEASPVQTLLVDNPGEIDLSALQLLWSLAALRKSKGQSMTIGMALAENDIALFRACGFYNLITPLN